MGTENLFSTPRENILTGEQMLENAIRRKQIQRENMKALTEARKLTDSTEDFTATMEANNIEAEEKNKKDSAMENAFYKQGAKNIIKEQLTMRPRLIKEGTEQVWNKVIGEIIYESYWLDEPVKESTVNQIEDSVGQILSYIDDKCPGSKVPTEKHNKLLKNISSVIDSVVREATDRIVNEAIEANSAFNEFELNSEEEEKLDSELRDLGRDEIIELIKGKVAQVIQDEKEKGKERAETFNEIDETIKANEEDEKDLADGDIHTEDGEEVNPDEGSSEGETSTEESFVPSMEGGTWDTLKVLFSDDKKEAVMAYKKAAKFAKQGNYAEAAKEYKHAKDMFVKMKREVQRADESVLGSICSFMLDGWLKNVFIASLGGPAKGTEITKGVCVALSATLGLTIPYMLINQFQTNEENTKNDIESKSSNTYKTETIYALDLNIKACDTMISQCNSKGKNKTSLKEALMFDSTDNRYTATERYVSNILEAGAPFNEFEDPSWGEFKACISLLCKKAKNILLMNTENNYCHAMTIIDDICSRLSNVPEDVPGDVKEFIMAMVSLIYGAVPTDEVIISRMSNPMGSPDLTSLNPSVNYTTISWNDLLVNIKTNLSSIKSYCESKCSSVTQPEFNPLPAQSFESTFESLVMRKRTQDITKNIGNSLFEAMMIGNISETEKIAMEGTQNFNNEEVEDAALIESLLQYTVFETLDTLGLYKFRLNDIKAIKMDFMNGVTEGASPIYGESDSQTMSTGKDKKGKKKVRINTHKIKNGCK